jgi:sulfoacetaldehyde dehydrogenase
MELVDLLLVTGDQVNVRRGYRSGTPCIGVGKGNVPVIVHHTADLEDAAEKIAKSKTFDNATSCSSENAVIVEAEVYDAFKDELQKAGAYLADETECAHIEATIFSNGSINREVIGKTLPTLSALAGLDVPPTSRFIAVEQNDVGPDHPLSGEKLSLVLSLYKAEDFEHAVRISNDILDYEGIGHSVGIHCSIPTYARRLARSSKVARVLMNQAHTFGNGGGFNNSLPFTLSMGCGTWAGNSISENMSYKNFINITTLATPIAERRVRAEDLFAEIADLSVQEAIA